MKNQAYILALVLLLASCTRITPVYPDTGAQGEITLTQPLVSPSTKALAGEMPLNYSTDESFGVYALYYPTGDFSGWENTTGSMIYIDGAEFSYNQSIDDATDGSGAWSATPGYYWPKGGKMTFAAWSPYRAKNDCTISYGPSGLQLTGFTTAEHGSEHYDLLYSERVYDKADCSGTSAQYDGIDLLFRHALTSLHFTASSSASTTKIRISKIVIYDICKSGDFSEYVSETDPSIYTSSPAWTLGSAKFTEASPLVVYENNSGTAAPALPLLGSGNSLDVGFALPIPQDITSAKMKVYYSVQLGSAEPVPTVSQALNLGSGTVTQWNRQTRYTYNLILGAQQIRFSVDVRGWSDSDNTDIQ